ncbi:MAG: hypothetical protein LBV16_09490 [Elusimicrobiota bacterium]|jgi:hypothetical protein|nr:hypothetical protein [Elusimicrobiota bacterium]
MVRIRIGIFILLSLVLLNSLLFAKDKKEKQIFQWDSTSFRSYYYFSNDTFYILFEHGSYYTLTELKNNKLYELISTSKEGEEYESDGMPYFMNEYKLTNSQLLGEEISDSQKIEISDSVYLQLNDNNEYISISERNAQYIIDECSNNRYQIVSYVYVDYANSKVFFRGKINNIGNGIVVCDIKQKKAKLIVKDDISFDESYQSVRIPNTEYLLYSKIERRFDDEIYNTKIFVIEIPEWKAEIEQQRKNKKLYPNAKKFFIDGPANIRDNPRGKSMVYLNDWTEVLVLNQQGDWYEILYANIKGWTYKDNLRIGVIKK